MNLVFLVTAEEELITEEGGDHGSETGDHGHHANSFFFPGDIREFYWGSAAFLVLVGLVIWKGSEALRDVLNARTQSISKELYEAKAERDAAERALKNDFEAQPDLAQEEAKIRREAEAAAEKVKADAIARAEADAEDIRERGKADIANRRREAKAALAAELAAMTRIGAEAVVQQSLDDKLQIDLIEKYINEVDQLS